MADKEAEPTPCKRHRYERLCDCPEPDRREIKMSEDKRPCQGGNVNICVGEGCYGQSCLTDDKPLAVDFRVSDKKDRAKHFLVGVVAVEDTHGKYFCSCGFMGSGTSRGFEALPQRLIANHKDHQYNALQWAERRKQKNEREGSS